MASAATHHSDNFAQHLATSGLRSTPQRELVYQSILDRRDHPTAEEIFARVKTELPSISLATIYNCLEMLIDCRLVRAVHFERAPTRYCPNLVPHAHFHDRETGATRDIALPGEMLAALRKLLPEGYTADDIDIIYHGRARADGVDAPTANASTAHSPTTHIPTAGAAAANAPVVNSPAPPPPPPPTPLPPTQSAQPNQSAQPIPPTQPDHPA